MFLNREDFLTKKVRHDKCGKTGTSVLLSISKAQTRLSPGTISALLVVHVNAEI